MADIAARVIIKIKAFTVGTDKYKNLKSVSYQENPLPTYGYRDEDNLRPTEHHDLPSDSPRFSGSIVCDSETLKALSGTSPATATFTGVDANGGAAVTGTITSPTFKAFSGGATEGRPEAQRLTFEATDINVA